MSAHGSHPNVKMSTHEIPDMKCLAPPSYPNQLHPDSPKRTCAHAIRSNFIWIPSEGHVACSPIRTREHHTRTIAYPIRMCCPDHWLNVSKPCYSPRSAAILSGRPVRTSFTPCILDLLMEKDFKALVLHVYELSIVLPRIPKNSPQSLIALVIEKLSKHQNLTQFD